MADSAAQGRERAARRDPRGTAELARAQHAAQQHLWPAAYTAFRNADNAMPLRAVEIEQLAMSAYLIGRVEESLEALRRAHHASVADGELRHAARCAFWMAFLLIDQGETTQANGWLSRANRLLQRVPTECAEHGYVLLPTAFQNALEGDYRAAHDIAARAAAIGTRVDSVDVTSLALHIQGRALVKEGRVAEGLSLLDESMLAVLNDQLSPPIAGTIYCSVIEACEEVSELRRAQDWTTALTQWCAQQPGMVTFTGNCLVHQAEIMQLRGEWLAAEEQAKRACERFAAAADKWATGAALYRQGEVYRSRGDMDAAQEAFEQAGSWGHDAQPGMALLRLAQGKTSVAVASIRRAVAEAGEPLRRAKLLPAAVEILLAAPDVDGARKAADELAEIAEKFGTAALRATAAGARGAVLLAEGSAQDALGALRDAWHAWRDLEAPHEAARARVLIGLCCRQLGDEDGATMELTGARRVFSDLGAAPDVARVDSLTLRPDGATAAHGLTGRELQVLRLVAQGMTNRAIAADLVLSEKTVDRHVSNIFGKLDVSSRAAATALAHRERLV